MTGRVALGGLALTLSFSASVARAQASSSNTEASLLSVTSGGDTQCPAPGVVEEAVLRLIPPEQHRLLSEHAVRIELEDQDTSYRVRVFKDGVPVAKTYPDPVRDCAGRANFAAVFAVLTVMPPDIGGSAEPEAKAEPKPEPKLERAPAVVAVPKLEPAPAPPRPLAQIELSGLLADAPAIWHAPQLTSFGGELRVVLGRGALTGTLSVAYLGRAKFELDGVQGDVTRLPVAVGMRLSHAFESLQIAGELDALAISERVRGTSLVASRVHDVLELGVRAGLQVSTASDARFRPFAGAFAWVAPAPRGLVAFPAGPVGNLPYLWVGGALGMSLGL